jgi:hypothetical protein
MFITCDDKVSHVTSRDYNAPLCAPSTSMIMHMKPLRLRNERIDGQFKAFQVVTLAFAATSHAKSAGRHAHAAAPGSWPA